MDQTAADQVNKAKADLQAQIDELKVKQVPVVPQTDTNMRSVYYATQPVDAGAKISPAFYEKKLTPNDVLPDAYGEGSDVVGFYAIRPIEKGDPLTPRNIGKTLPYLSQRIPPGMRALALPIFNADLNNTGGFVVDGDIVDLLYTPTVKNSDGEEGMVNTQTVLQKIQVLFVPGPQTRSDLTSGVMPAPAPGEPISVTFLVTPEEAQMLVHLVQEKDGHLNMILRGRNDKAVEKIKPYAISSIDDFRKAQKQMDKSYDRVADLQKQIEEQEQKEKDQAAAKGNPNETPHPSQPSQ